MKAPNERWREEGSYQAGREKRVCAGNHVVFSSLIYRPTIGASIISIAVLKLAPPTEKEP
jgi:hypothetical protein